MLKVFNFILLIFRGFRLSAMSLSFIKSTPAQAISTLADRLNDRLSDGAKVVWLVSGGSNIKLSVEVLAKLKKLGPDNLKILLSDERYGDFGHKDSNLFQLRQAGLDLPDGMIYGPITKHKLPFKEAVDNYEAVFTQAMDWADYSVGQFGIGADGHTAGILPNSPAARSLRLVIGYEAQDYQRITMTAKAIKLLNVAYALAFGTSKTEPLEKLRDQNLSVEDQPAQIFKQLTEAYIINDIIGDLS